MTSWYLQVQHKNTLRYIEIEQDTQPKSRQILQEIRRAFGVKRLNHDQLSYVFVA